VRPDRGVNPRVLCWATKRGSALNK
jgi:hypothetical protein